PPALALLGASRALAAAEVRGSAARLAADRARHQNVGLADRILDQLVAPRRRRRQPRLEDCGQAREDDEGQQEDDQDQQRAHGAVSGDRDGWRASAESPDPARRSEEDTSEL